MRGAVLEEDDPIPDSRIVRKPDDLGEERLPASHLGCAMPDITDWIGRCASVRSRRVRQEPARPVRLTERGSGACTR